MPQEDAIVGRATRFLAVLTTALTVAWMPGALPCHAQDAIKLSDLINGGDEIIHGDTTKKLKFDQFSYEFTGEMPPAEMVNVVPIEDLDNNLGIQFHGDFVDLFSSQGGSDALISYRVTVLDPVKEIVDAHLFGNPERLGETGTISVVENFVFDGAGEHQMSIYDDEGAGSKNADSTEFSPRRELYVRKDIGGLAGPDGTVRLSYVDQTFSQVTAPEASSGLLMLAGLVCLAGARMGRRCQG